ncbi:MAG: glycosyltransferase family 39 protein, partial [Planctomycetota bacterium]|nr:glycosyltransferase family 39 protein [Planctomycetota bacterium]
MTAPPKQADRFRLIIIGLFVLAAALRCVDVWRPVDGTMREAWREPDVAGIARNYFEEDMNFFTPRIDWREDGPGYVESEFPLFAWSGAVLYHAFGYHEELLRVMSYVLSLGALCYFYRLAAAVLPPWGVVIAMLVYAVNPLSVRLASSIQAEPLMFFAYIGAVHHFLQWCRDQSRFQFWAAMLMTTLAILAKAPAAHLGLLFAPLCLQSFGWSTFRRKDVLVFAGVVLAIPVAWYAYAHGIWLEYGNSLGISNESYGRITSLSFIDALSGTVRGIVTTEIDLIWMPTGLCLAACAIPLAITNPHRRVLLYWCLALGAFYLVTGRTTGEGWAAYYHIVSLPAAAMLIGAGVCDIWSWCSDAGRRLSNVSMWRTPSLAIERLSVALLLTATLFTASRTTAADMRPHGFVPLHECAQRFAIHVADDGLIVASGAEQVDFFGL